MPKCRSLLSNTTGIRHWASHSETPNGLSMKTLDKEVFDAIIVAGIVRISLAIQSGSDYIRDKIMRKHLSREKIYEVVGPAKSCPNLFINAFFIIGMPEEISFERSLFQKLRTLLH